MNHYETNLKKYVATLENSHREINQIPVNSDYQKKYTEGYLLVSSEALSSIKAFIDEDNLCKDYRAKMCEMRNEYHKKYLLLKKAKEGAFEDGQCRAAKDVDNDLDNMVQIIAHDELQKLKNHQQQTPSRRR